MSWFERNTPVQDAIGEKPRPSPRCTVNPPPAPPNARTRAQVHVRAALSLVGHVRYFLFLRASLWNNR